MKTLKPELKTWKTYEMPKETPYWTQVAKYKKGTGILEKEYPATKFHTVKESIDRINEIKFYLYKEYAKAYEHDLYDWVIYCDQYTQMILDQMENL